MQVRIRDKDMQIILTAFKQHFSNNDHLWLFGSRVDMKRRGGDIDFYIETTESDVSEAIKKEKKFVIELWDKLGDQKIDTVLNILSLEGALPIYRIAKSTGVQLL